MTVIAQLDQFITSLQTMRANLEQVASRREDAAAQLLGNSFSDALASLMAPLEDTPIAAAIPGIETVADEVETLAASTLERIVQTVDVDALAGEDFLTTDLGHASTHRPSVKEFMDATGLEFNDAASLLYIGTAGYADHRNWEKIMASSDPARAASLANGQQFTSGVDWAPHRDDGSMLDPDRVVAQSGNYALYRMPSRTSGDLGYVTLQMVDADGRRLTQAGVTADQISRNAWLYGLDKGDLAELASVADEHNPSLATAMRATA
jgi:hypothetical protein